MHIRDEFFVITILTSICLPFFSFFHLIWCLVPYAISIFPLFKQNELFSGVFTFVYNVHICVLYVSELRFLLWDAPYEKQRFRSQTL